MYSEDTESESIVDIVAPDQSWCFTVSFQPLWDDVLPEWREAMASVGSVMGPTLKQALEDAGTLAPVEIDVLLTDDQRVRDLNGTYRDKDTATNVLSFASWWDDDCPPPPAPDVPISLGDLALALETLRSEATADDKSLRAHFIHLVLHGSLHLLGYDHIDDADAEIMEDLETQLLASLGIDDPHSLPILKGDETSHE